jgi:hypothetical protein
MRALDPSEACDSANILSSLKLHFPQATVVPLGGVIYSLALSGVLANFDPDNVEDIRIVQMGLQLDEALSTAGMNLRAASVFRA